MLQSQGFGNVDGVPGVLVVVDEFPNKICYNNYRFDKYRYYVIVLC
jgi:hypothetical protein